MRIGWYIVNRTVKIGGGWCSIKGKINYYPQQVKITEVGPRDGFQNIAEWIPSDTKLDIIADLVKAGLGTIEATSFVNPAAISQMKDAQLIASTVLREHKKTEFAALVPNKHGAIAAWNAGIRRITYVVSASEAHNLANVNRTVRQSMDELKDIMSEKKNFKINFALATVFGCPFQGKVGIDDVLDIIRQGKALGVENICLSDTIGIADPMQMQHTLEIIGNEYELSGFSLHLHNTRGMGLANSVVALQCGIFKFETAIGGLGGCPFVPGAAGNVATEDFVHMLEAMDIKTGIDLQLLLKTVDRIKKEVRTELNSCLSRMVQKC